MRPPERPAALERAEDRGGDDPVAVGARAGVAACVEAVWRGRALEHRDLVRQDRVQRAGEVARRLASPLEARHLTPRVNARVGAPGNGEGHGLAEDALERALDLALHGAQAGLRGPAREGRAVVRD